MGEIKQFIIKNWIYFSYNDQVNLTDSEIHIYYIGYVTAKKLLIVIRLTV